MNHKDMDVWKQAMRLVEDVYKLTACFPRDETYGIRAQMRRAAVSVPSNISEGAGRSSPRELTNFLNIALGSLAELETQLLISERLGYCEPGSALDRLGRVKMLIVGTKRSLSGSGLRKAGCADLTPNDPNA
jgi:four helix bundle protein